ncbi:MAG: hypothetical protein ACXWL5_04065 [Candidatus Chromulinivorax sp.]
MKIKTAILFFTIIATSSLQSKTMQPNEIKAWLELDALKKNMQNMITKYSNLQADLKNQANQILEKSIQTADELAQSDPYAALVMNYDMQRLIDKVDKTSLDINAIEKKYEELKNYINKSIKELLAMRRKSLQFP